MRINRRTKISEIIKHHPDAINVIASINAHFKKLKNPFLRKILASRVTIEEAAKIGQCKVDDFFEALSKIGFEIEKDTQEEMRRIKEDVLNRNEDLIKKAIYNNKVKELDVRPMLEKGIDPFHSIRDELTSIPQGYALKLITTFEPTPLIRIFSKKSYASYVENEGDVVNTYFLKFESTEKETTSSLIYFVTQEELYKEKEKYSDCKEIDVRELEMPLPMINILDELEKLEEHQALFVHHKRVPQYLLSELDEKKVKIWIAEIDEGNVKLLIHY